MVQVTGYGKTYQQPAGNGTIDAFSWQSGLIGDGILQATAVVTLISGWEGFREKWEGSGTVAYVGGLLTNTPQVNHGEDRVRIHIYTMQGFADVTTAITFRRDYPGAIANISGLLPWTDFTLTASFHDPLFVQPITLEWERNGQVLQSLDASNPDAVKWHDNAGPMGTTYDYVFRATDAQGRTKELYHRYVTKLCEFEGCNDQ